MDEIYKVSAAKTPEEKLALAKQLFEVARSHKVKAEERFVLLRKTTDLAAEGGDVTLVLNATRQAGGEFDFDFLAVQAEGMARIAARPMDAARLKALLAGASQAVDQAVTAGRTDLAGEFVNVARQVAERKEGSEYRPLTERLQAEVAKAAAKRLEISEAQAALAASPDDADANRWLGAYYCLAEGDWEHGLACLAKESDRQISRLAAADLSRAAEPGRGTGRARRPVVGSCPGAARRRARRGDARRGLLVRTGPPRAGGGVIEGAGRVAAGGGRQGGWEIVGWDKIA